jgi:hypothetical protein
MSFAAVRETLAGGSMPVAMDDPQRVVRLQCFLLATDER